MQGLSLIVALSLVTYRITRFALDDTLLEEWRWKLQDWLRGGPPGTAGPPPSILRQKLLSLTDCPYCFSVWVAAGATALTDWRTSVQLPVWTWLATCGAAMAWWRLIETPHE